MIRKAILPLAALLAGCTGAAIAPPQVQAQAVAVAPARDAAARELVARAAQAMGGEAALNAVNTITATGYGQYAYQWGGGGIDGSPFVPEKLLAANDLTRTYDLAGNRFAMRERRNMLFPFLARFGHSFALNDMRLDGDIAFDMREGQGVRMPTRSEGALLNDGVHMRRMWMLNNPAVLLRRMLDPATALSAPRAEGEAQVVDIVLAEGDRLSAGFGADGLPLFVRWGSWHANFGQITFTTHLTGWVVWDGRGGIRLPLGYRTSIDWRDVTYFTMFVDAYQVNGEIADLAAPAAVRAAPEQAMPPLPQLTHVNIAPGLWRISNGSTLVEFADHLVLFELGVNPDVAAEVLDRARSLAPGKPIRYLVASHNHIDHTAGIRQAVAEGITIIQRPSVLRALREMAEHPAPDYPDELARNPQPFRELVMDEHLRLQDATRTLDLYWGRNNGHMSEVVFGYVPEAKLLMEGDMVSAAYEWSHWPDSLRDVIAHYRLDVERISPAHTMREIAPDILTLAQAEELIAGGVARARQHCAERLASGNYWPGCPVQSRHY